MINKGIIVSIQGYSKITTEELAKEAINAGATAIKTDKEISTNSNIPIVGCHKIKVEHPEKQAYLTPTIELIEEVKKWSDYVSIDYRRCNKDLKKISDYCKEHKIKVIADIQNIEDYRHIKKNMLHYTYIATTFSVFSKKFYPDVALAKELMKEEKHLIAEGNFKTRAEVKDMFNSGVNLICIGGAISNVYKLTRKYTTIIL